MKSRSLRIIIIFIIACESIIILKIPGLVCTGSVNGLTKLLAIAQIVLATIAIIVENRHFYKNNRQ